MSKIERLTPLFTRAGIYKKWQNVTLESFANCDDAKRKVEKYVLEYDPSKTLFGLNLIGCPGSGKSHLLNWMAVSFMLRGIEVVVAPLNHLMSLYTASFNSAEEKRAMTSILKVPNHLFIEDVGLEFKSDLATKVLTLVLRNRINQQKPVTIATNLKPKEIIDQYGEEVSSLMKEVCIPVLISGKDFRGKIFDQNKESLK